MGDEIDQEHQAWQRNRDGSFGNHTEADGDCTRDNVAACASADPKMSAFRSHTPGLQITYYFDRLSRRRGLHWLENGWIEATYNYVRQTNRYGDVRALGSLAFSLAW